MTIVKPTREEVMKQRAAKEKRRVAALERQRALLKDNVPLVTKQIDKLNQLSQGDIHAISTFR